MWIGPGKEEEGDGVSVREDRVTMRGGERESRKRRKGREEKNQVTMQV